MPLGVIPLEGVLAQVLIAHDVVLVQWVREAVAVVIGVDGVAQAVRSALGGLRGLIVVRHDIGVDWVSVAACVEADHLGHVEPAVAVVVVVGVVADSVAVEVVVLVRVHREVVVDVYGAVVVVIGIDDVALVITVVVRGHRESVHRVSATVRLLRVEPSVAVVVGVGVVTHSVTVVVRVLGSIVREGVVDIRRTVAVIVSVDLVAQTVAVVVVGHRVSV